MAPSPSELQLAIASVRPPSAVEITVCSAACSPICQTVLPSLRTRRTVSTPRDVV